MATTYCSTTSEGHAGAELAKDNRELKQDAADHLGRSAEDVSTCRRSKNQPQLTLSRNSSTDEAQLESGRWSAQEHARFVDGLEKYGRRKWIRIAEHVGTRTVIQVRSHAQKYFKKLRRAAQPPPARKVSSDDEVSLARAAAVPNLDARPQLALLTAAAKLLDGVAERPAARAPIEMERKRARSDDSDESFVRGVSPDAGLPACVSSDTLHVVGGNNTPPSPPRALHGPVVSNADLPDLAKRRKVDEPSPAPAQALAA